MMAKEVVIRIQVPEAKPEKPAEVDKDRLVDLDKGAYPQLHLQGQQLPFDETDVGKEVPITGMVKLASIKYQGYNYTFEMTKLDFPGREIDKGTIKARKRKKEERINLNRRKK